MTNHKSTFKYVQNHNTTGLSKLIWYFSKTVLNNFLWIRKSRHTGRQLCGTCWDVFTIEKQNFTLLFQIISNDLLNDICNLYFILFIPYIPLFRSFFFLFICHSLSILLKLHFLINSFSLFLLFFSCRMTSNFLTTF